LARLKAAAFSSALLVCVAAVSARAGIFPGSAFSDKAAGTTGALFLKIPAGARAMALGGSYSALVGDAESVFWNPAGLTRLEDQGRADAALSYNMLLETAYSGSAALGFPLGEDRGVLGAALTYFSQSSIQGYGITGDPTSSFTPMDLAVSLAYGRVLGRVRAGGAFKFIRSELAGASGTSFAVDLGVQADHVSDIGEGPVDLAAAISNLGPPIKLGSTADPLPFKAVLGAHWRISPNLSGLLDGHIPSDADPYASFGLEARQSFGSGLGGALRAGYNVKDGRSAEGLSGMSAGGGLQIKQGRLDYAWVPFGDLGMTHRISIGFKF